MPPLLKLIGKMVIGQAAGIGLFAGGMWLIFKALGDSNVLFGVLGGAMVLGGMWVMTQVRRMQSEL